MAEADADGTLLEIRQLDLLSDEGWATATAGCRFVLHVASPFVTAKPKDPEDVIRPAVQGTTRALDAALNAGVERVVLTSSLAALQYAPARRGHVFTASDWTGLDGRRRGAYALSKVRLSARRGTSPADEVCATDSPSSNQAQSSDPSLPTRAMPTWLTRIASVFEPQLRDNRWLIGSVQRFDHGAAEALLGHPLRSIPDTIEETGRSLLERGLV